MKVLDLERNPLKQLELDDALQNVEFLPEDTMAAFPDALADSVEVGTLREEGLQFRIHSLLVFIDGAYRLYVVAFDKELELSPHHSGYTPPFDFTLTKPNGDVVTSERDGAQGGSYTSYVTLTSSADLIGAMLELAS